VPGALISEATPEPALDEPAAEIDPELQTADEEDSVDASNLTVTDSQVSWTQPLRLSHQLARRFPLPDPIVSKMRTPNGPSRLRLLLTHDGYDLDITQAQQETRTELYGPSPELADVDWPLEYFPGIVLTCTWPLGGSVVRCTSTLLDAPVTVDGFEIEHRYDKSILTRDNAPGAPTRHSSGTGAGRSTGASGTLTLAERVLRAVRRLGLLDPDGRAILAGDRLPATVYGDGAHGSAAQDALNEAVSTLLAAGDLVESTGSVIAGRLHHPARDAGSPCRVLIYEPQVKVGAPRPPRRPGTTPLDPRFVRLTDVTGHLRYIGHLGWEAGDAARAAYRQDRTRYGLAGPAELPTGYTYVSPFQRGG
jgi:hypothetical protein